MTLSPTDTRPGTAACPGADVCPDAHVWVDGDGVPSAGQLAVWFAHPSAVLDDAWAHATPAAAALATPAPGNVALAAVSVGVDVDDPAGTPWDGASGHDAATATAAGVDDRAATDTGDDADTGHRTAIGDDTTRAAEATAVGVPGWVEPEWLDTPVRPEVRALMGLAPGPGLLAALVSLPAGPCPDAHDGVAAPGRPVPGSAPGWVCACQVVTAAAWDAMATWTGTRAAVQLVDIAGQDLLTALPDGVPVAARATDPCRVELAPMLHLSPDATGTRLAHARTLTAHRALVDACTTGLISAAGARAIVGQTGFLSPAATAAVVTAVVAKVHARRDAGAAGWTASDLRQVAKRAVQALNDDAKEQARANAYADRRASVTPAGHGMAWLSFLIRDVDAHRIYNRLTAQAAAAKTHARDHHTGDGRTTDQHRADIATTTLLGHTHPTHTHTSGDTEPHTDTGDRTGTQGQAGTGTGNAADANHADTTPDDAHHRHDCDAGARTRSQADADAGAQADAGSQGAADVDADADSQGEPGAGDGTDGDHPAGDHLGCASPDACPDVDHPAGPARPGDPDVVTPAPDTPAPGATGPVPRPGRPEINVIVTLATLLGLLHDPAQVPGLGPIHPDIARELAADGRWRLWLTDPATGQVTATGARTYTPTAALARLIRAREPVCRMPGCNRQAINCDLDHTVPWPAEPGTVAANLGPLCRAHHNLKTHHGYTLTNNPPPNPHGDPDPDGPGPNRDLDPDTSPPSWTWTMPSGMHHTRTPDPPLQE